MLKAACDGIKVRPQEVLKEPRQLQHHQPRHIRRRSDTTTKLLGVQVAHHVRIKRQSRLATTAGTVIG
jgi:hypothetical protein